MSDFIIIGGGIAGISAAARLSAPGSVTLLEAEGALAHHASGRSAALYEPRYGAPAVVELSLASGPFPRGGECAVAARVDERGEGGPAGGVRRRSARFPVGGGVGRGRAGGGAGAEPRCGDLCRRGGSCLGYRYGPAASGLCPRGEGARGADRDGGAGERGVAGRRGLASRYAARGIHRARAGQCGGGLGGSGGRHGRGGAFGVPSAAAVDGADSGAGRA